MRDSENNSNNELLFGKNNSNTAGENTTPQSSAGNNSPDNSSGTTENKQAAVNLPVGGGAIRGIGEKFQANPVTGTASFNVPITISEGRNGFTPQLSLNYDSGSGNGVFGLGWNISLPGITRKTDKGLPQYNDNYESESDVFILSGAEDLVPVLNADKTRKKGGDGDFNVYYYIPRIEGLFAQIERWENKETLVSHWRSISKDNIVSIYGYSEKARIYEKTPVIDDDNSNEDYPNKDKKVFSWLLEESWDSKGNLMQFEYKEEDSLEVPSNTYEKERINRDLFVNKYLKKVSYGNSKMCNPVAPTHSGYGDDFYFKLVFDYGDHNKENPSEEWDLDWPCRKDPFSDYKPGFEVRTYRLCKRILMFHKFEALGDNPVLVKSTEFEYNDTTSFAVLERITHKGFYKGGKDYLPPLDFKYTQAKVAEKFRKVPKKMLENLPSGVDSLNYMWADLYSEGLSGILKQDNQAWYFIPNCGDIRFLDDSILEPRPVFGHIRGEIPKPSAVMGMHTSFRLDDVDSDNYPELIIQNQGINGFFSRNEEGKWDNFRNFKEYPNINFSDDNLRFIDLSGDGLSDIVISKGEYFDIYFSEGKEGYGKFRRVRCTNDTNGAPVIVFSDAKRRIFLADMSGDGLTDIVKITEKSVCYWPNLGYGRFGEKIIMGNPPLLDSSEQFDARYIHLADVDGTGTTDLLYISNGKIKYYKNLSGNSWESINIGVNMTFNSTQYNYIQTVDILGNGTQCLVFSSSLPGKQKEMLYLELTSGVKPFLLNNIINNMGAERNLYYAPSTKFYIKDKLRGKPWITKLPFVVHVLEKVEVIDYIGETCFTSKYAYHHGYYDTKEREFRGFGMVEQWDTDELKVESEKLKASETVNSGQFSTLDSQLSILDIPPTYTKTWFHTGFYKNRKNISRLYEAEYFQGDEDAWLLDDTTLDDTWPGEECREACRALKGRPLRVEIYAQDYSDKELIPYTVEEKNYNLQCLQRKNNNKHAVFLVTDSEQLMYYYERNIDDPRISHSLILQSDTYGNPIRTAQIAYPRRSGTYPEQNNIKAVYALTEYINKINDNSFRYIGVPFHSIQYELFNISYAGTKFTISDILDIAVNSIEIDSADTPSGTEPQKQIFAQERTLFWNDTLSGYLDWGQIASHGLPYQQQTLEFTKKQLDNFGLSFSDMHYWGYLLDGIKVYNPKEVTRFDPSGFYLPISITDTYGNLTTIEYDIYKLFISKVSRPLNHITHSEYDYIILQPWKIIDPNDNSQMVAFDALGMVLRTALAGKNGEGDTLEDPTEQYAYDIHRWEMEEKPTYAHISTRETHGDPNTRWFESYVYTDGLGNEIMSKSRVADGLAWTIVNNSPDQVQSTDRWLASGKIILNNKGLAVCQYEPWFSVNHEYEADERLSKYGVTPLMHYDPLGRLIQTDFPNGTTTKVEFDVWQQKNYDQNDCDINSLHYNTPQVIDFDVLGRPFQVTDDNGSYGKYTTHNTIDILDRILVVRDAKGNERMTVNRYGVGKENMVATENIDSGGRSQLIDAVGNRYYRWDSRGQTIMNRYDSLLRPTDTLLETGGTPAKLVQRIIYGNDADLNNIGQIAEIWDQDGKTFFEYDFKGNIISVQKHFTVEYADAIDWNNNNALGEQFKTYTEYNALNQPILLKTPDNKKTYYTYDKGGLLIAVQVETNSPYINDIEYNEKGQRLAVYYDNNTKTKYEYDSKNFRLTRIFTTRNTGGETLQDLNYTYDSVGNIITLIDDAGETVYFNNQEITPTGTYTYDALYRLIEATGRELYDLAMPNHEDYSNTGSNAIQNYVHKYEYDELGNIQKLQSVGSWTRNYDYGTNNYLLGHGEGTVYTYDPHGNMLTMEHLSSLQWDYLDQLHSTTNGTFKSYYCYDSEGNRTRKVVEKQDGSKEERYYVGNYELYKKSGSSDNYERETLKISDDIKTFALIETKSTIQIINGEPVKTSEPPVIRYQYDNNLGSACLELDGEGNIISYEEYHPFGTTSYRTGNSGTEVSLKRYRYCFKERDEETGLYYYGVRYYAAWLCRFVSVDPLQHEYPHYTPYQYAGNKPITYIDLDGLEEFPNPFDYVLQELKGMWDTSMDFLGFNSTQNNVEKKEEAVERYELTVEHNGQPITIYMNKGGIMNAEYKDNTYVFFPGGYYPYMPYQRPENLAYFIYNQDKFVKSDGSIANFEEVFMSKDEWWNEVGTDMLLEITEMFGSNVGPNMELTGERIIKVEKYEKWKWNFPPRSEAETKMFKQREKDLREIELIEVVPFTFRKLEDEIMLKNLKEKYGIK